MAKPNEIKNTVIQTGTQDTDDAPFKALSDTIAGQLYCFDERRVRRVPHLCPGPNCNRPRGLWESDGIYTRPDWPKIDTETLHKPDESKGVVDLENGTQATEDEQRVCQCGHIRDTHAFKALSCVHVACACFFYIEVSNGK